MSAAAELTRQLLRDGDYIDGHVGILDREEHGVVSVHLNGDAAEALLASAGYVRKEVLFRGKLAGVVWCSPDPDDTRMYDRGEALLLVLTARAVCWRAHG